MRQQMRWIALAPLAIGLVLLWFGALWTEWPQLVSGLVLCAGAALLWRASAGSWKLDAPSRQT